MRSRRIHQVLDKAKFKYKKTPCNRSVPRKLTQFNLKDFDMVALFAPIGVRSLLQNFPHFKDDPIPIAAFGAATHAALQAAGIKLTIAAPTKSAPSMAMAIENYLNGKQQEAVIVARPATIKAKATRSRTASALIGTKKSKSVFTNKAKYKQLMEDKKAKAAARKADRERRKREAAEAAALTDDAHPHAETGKTAEGKTGIAAKVTKMLPRED